MRKVILFIAIVLSLTGCKQDDAKFSPESTMDLDQCMESFERNQKQIKKMEEAFANRPEPQSFVIIDSMIKHLPPTWSSELINETAISSKLPNGRYLIDLCLIFNADDINDEQVVADWLEENDQYMNFDQSKIFIEAAHRIQHPIDLNSIKRENPTFVSRDVLKFMDDNLIKDNQFDAYIRISLDANYALSSGSYKKKIIAFSAPLFKSIVSNHTDANVEFKFAKVFFRGGETIIMQAVDKNKNDKHIGYYDFTHRPRYVIPN